MKSAIDFFQDKLSHEMDPSDLYAALGANEHVVVIDCRKAFAYEHERIPGAINLNHRDMNEKTTAAFDRSAIYVTYCDGIGCNGSTKGALNMVRLGFKVRELVGGIEWWILDGYQTEGTHQTAGLAIQCAC